MVTIERLIAYGAVLLLLLYIWQFGSEIKEVVVQVPSTSGEVTIEVPKPLIERDTIYVKGDSVLHIVEVPNPINLELESKYLAAMQRGDSLEQLALYRDAVTERNYTEMLADSIITIYVDSHVIGTLASQRIRYVTKPQSVTLEVPKKRPQIYVGGFISANEFSQSYGAKLSYLSPNQLTILSGGFATDRKIYISLQKKLF